MSGPMPLGYYDRDDASKNYDYHLFLAGAGLQSAELNEIQRTMARRTRSLGDALFADGDVIRDASCVVNPDTGLARLGAGVVYIGGAVRGVPPAEFTVPVVGVIAIGIYVTERVVTALEDPSLLDPAQGTRNYQEPGAARLQVNTEWGYTGDGKEGEFFAVYTVEDGNLRSKEPPPNMDAVTQALARYDRDSAGGTYIVQGLSLSVLPNFQDGQQVYSLSEGRARVNGYGVDLATSRRVVYDAAPDLRTITSEPHLSTTAARQKITLDRAPAARITQVLMTAEKTVSMTHGSYTGAKDVLPDTGVLSILSVTQGATTYDQGVSYKLTAGAVDWSLTGPEPSPGSTYQVTYRYMTDVEPESFDEDHFYVTGAIPDTLVIVSYEHMLPRIDRLCLNADGSVEWVAGIAADFNPQPPSIPSELLPIASVYQTWWASKPRLITNDGVRTVPMPVLANIENRIDHAMQLIAQQRLESEIHTREAGTKKGLFTDPFIDDSQRDAGIPQTGAIVRGILTLPIAAEVKAPSNDITQPVFCSFAHTVAVNQPLRTGSMKINPYMAFEPVPAKVTLTPNVDRWTEVQTSWTSASTSRFVFGSGDMSSTSVSTNNVMLSSQTSNIENLRQINVRFEISGFGPLERLDRLMFDGVSVQPTA